MRGRACGRSLTQIRARIWVTCVVALVLVPLLAACSEPDPQGRASLSVYAASSLTEAFTELASMFEEAHPEADVSLTFAGSQVLRLQIEEGAPADVFASANVEHMEALVRAQLVRWGRYFASSELVLIVPPDNPAGIESFADLPEAERIVLGTPEVPVGRYARELLAAADTLVQPGFRSAVLEHVVSEESNVRLARSKVELGEADAAIVYSTDAVASDGVRAIPIPPEVNVPVNYLMGPVGSNEDDVPELVMVWLELVSSPVGRAVLRRHGFGTE